MMNHLDSGFGSLTVSASPSQTDLAAMAAMMPMNVPMPMMTPLALIQPNSVAPPAAAANPMLTALQHQIEFYFSLDNLTKDAFLLMQLSEKDYSVPVALIAQFRQVQRMTHGDMGLVLTAMQMSPVLVVEGDRVRPLFIHLDRHILVQNSETITTPGSFPSHPHAPKWIEFDPMTQKWCAGYASMQEALSVMTFWRRQTGALNGWQQLQCRAYGAMLQPIMNNVVNVHYNNVSNNVNPSNLTPIQNNPLPPAAVAVAPFHNGNHRRFNYNYKNKRSNKKQAHHTSQSSSNSSPAHSHHSPNPALSEGFPPLVQQSKSPLPVTRHYAAVVKQGKEKEEKEEHAVSVESEVVAH